MHEGGVVAESFEVNTGGLRAGAEALDGLAVYSASGGPACTYADRHLSLTFIDTMFLYALAVSATNKARTAIQEMVALQSAALTASANVLRATADTYDATDDAADARMDRLHPDGPPSGSIANPWGSSVYVVPAPVADVLTEPAWVPSRDLVSEIVTTDWLSPTTVVNEIIDWVFDFDVLAEVSKAFSGNWQALYLCKDALGQLAAAQALVAAHIDMTSSRLRDDWSGIASMAAARYFANLAATARANGTALLPVAGEFEVVAVGMESASAVVADLLASVMDWMIAAAVMYALAAVLAETVVGGVIGFLAGTGSLGYALWLARQVGETIQGASRILDGLSGAVGMLATIGMGDLAFTLPAAYENPSLP